MMTPIQTGVKHGPSGYKALIWKRVFPLQMESKEKRRYDGPKKLQGSRRKGMIARRWFLSLLILLVMGCAPVISQDALKEVDVV
jgi:hypothetical protein